jgi:hypothetical protein
MFRKNESNASVRIFTNILKHVTGKDDISFRAILTQSKHVHSILGRDAPPLDIVVYANVTSCVKRRGLRAPDSRRYDLVSSMLDSVEVNNEILKFDSVLEFGGDGAFAMAITSLQPGARRMAASLSKWDGKDVKFVDGVEGFFTDQTIPPLADLVIFPLSLHHMSPILVKAYMSFYAARAKAVVIIEHDACDDHNPQRVRYIDFEHQCYRLAAGMGIEEATQHTNYICMHAIKDMMHQLGLIPTVMTEPRSFDWKYTALFVRETKASDDAIIHLIHDILNTDLDPNERDLRETSRAARSWYINDVAPALNAFRNAIKRAHIIASESVD